MRAALWWKQRTFSEARLPPHKTCRACRWCASAACPPPRSTCCASTAPPTTTSSASPRGRTRTATPRTRTRTPKISTTSRIGLWHTFPIFHSVFIEFETASLLLCNGWRRIQIDSHYLLKSRHKYSKVRIGLDGISRTLTRTLDQPTFKSPILAYLFHFAHPQSGSKQGA